MLFWRPGRGAERGEGGWEGVKMRRNSAFSTGVWSSQGGSRQDQPCEVHKQLFLCSPHFKLNCFNSSTTVKILSQTDNKKGLACLSLRLSVFIYKIINNIDSCTNIVAPRVRSYYVSCHHDADGANEKKKQRHWSKQGRQQVSLQLWAEINSLNVQWC